MAPAKQRQSLAVFDLDRTLLRGGSGPIIQESLRRRGIGPKSVPGSDALFQIFNVIGETRPSMELAKLAVKASKGWPVDEVAVAVEDAAEELVGLVHPYAHELIDEHHDAGRKVVIASTSPLHFVEGLARRIGVDHVLATRWANDGSTYLGDYDGPFVWGRTKRDVVAAYAAEVGASLASCWAYSDSYFDAPLLASVGHPVAVNPDARLSVLATLKGWPIRHLDVPEGVIKVAGVELQRIARPFLRPELLPNARFEIDGLENIPADGGAVLCANHRSYFDATAVAMLIARAGRTARFLGKTEVFDAPIVGKIAAGFGGIRVDRGTGSDEPLEKAAAALRAGDLVAMMPEGTIPRGPAFFEPELKGRWGAAKLASLAGVPIIPVGLWGTENVWPRSSRLPNFDVTAPPLVQLRVGTPFRVKGKDLDADTRLLMRRIVELLPAEARERRDPSEEELRRSYPPGYRGNPASESQRRPGTD